MQNVLEIENRTLNEIVNLMIKNDYKIIAKEDILPIVLETAKRKKQIAKISDSRVIKIVKYFQKELSESN